MNLSNINGKSDIGLIDGINATNDYHVRDEYKGKKGGHDVDSWLNYLIDYWRGLGIPVTVHE